MESFHKGRRPKRRRFQPGDIISVALPTELRYLQYVGPHGGLDLLRVVDCRSGSKPLDVDYVSGRPTIYWIWGICSVLLSDDRFQYVGKGTPPPGDMPVLRRPALQGGWALVKGDREGPVVQMDDEVAKLSLEVSVGPNQLVQRLLSGWRPEWDQEELPQYFARIARKQQDRSPRHTIFYVEFSQLIGASKALKAVAELSAGLQIEQAKRTLTVKYNWRQNDSLHEIDAVERQITEVCKRFGGTCTGRETSI